MSELNVTSKMIKVITGFNLRTAQRILTKVRMDIDRSAEQYVSLHEFCTIKKIDEEHARQRLKRYGML